MGREFQVKIEIVLHDNLKLNRSVGISKCYSCVQKIKNKNALKVAYHYLRTTGRGFIILRILGEDSAVVNDRVEGRVEVDHEDPTQGCDVHVPGVTVHCCEDHAVLVSREYARLGRQ